MKTKRYLVQGFLLLLCSLTAMAGSPSEGTQHPQEPQKQNGKRPRIQTSASEKEIVFKPVTGQGQTVVNDSPKKKEAKRESRQPKTKVSRQRKVSERYMALKTNIAYDAIAVPNLAFEIQCSKHISVELPVMFSGWDISSEHAVRTFAIQPEGRNRPFLRSTRPHGILQCEMGREPLSGYRPPTIGSRCKLWI